MNGTIPSHNHLVKPFNSSSSAKILLHNCPVIYSKTIPTKAAMTGLVNPNHPIVSAEDNNAAIIANMRCIDVTLTVLSILSFRLL